MWILRGKTKAIKEYMANQLKHDKESDQLSFFDPQDPFMGNKWQLHGWQANKKRTCALPVSFRALPENEIPPVWRVDVYLFSSMPCLPDYLSGF